MDALPQNYPNLAQFSRNIVAEVGKVEVIRQPLYDYILYPTAGSAAPFLFFTTQQGQGVSSSTGNAANAKGISDTNMQQSGLLPSPQAFWVEGIEFDVQPGSVNTANTYTVQVPTQFAAANAATVQAGAHDVNAILSGGVLQLRISNKDYYTDGPLYNFPPSKYFSLNSDVATTSGTVGEFLKEKMRAQGKPVTIDPGLGIAPMQSFGVQVTYPTAIATPSGFNARIGVILPGWLFRPVQ